MPSTPAQFFGYGFGPGHHAPMVRMPRCTPMSVKRIEIVRPQGCQQPCGYGATAQPSGYGIATAPQPCYGNGPGAMQPVQSRPSNNSHDLFSAPANPMVPMAPQQDFTELPSVPAREPLTTPGN